MWLLLIILGLIAAVVLGRVMMYVTAEVLEWYIGMRGGL